MADFDEIEHSGGRISFGKDGMFSITNSVTWECSWYQVCVSYEGILLDVVPVLGIGRAPIFPKPSILAIVISDKNGLYGRTCPKCATYFRTDHVNGNTHCPYCGFACMSVAFTTKNQLEFIQAFCSEMLKAVNDGQDNEIDINRLTSQLSSNKSPWVYSEEEQQRQFLCPQCETKYDILGDYGDCPQCVRPNAGEVIDAKLSEIEAQFQYADKRLTDRQDRKVEWEKLTRSISEFEGLANTLRGNLLRLPATPRRKNDLRKVSFQNPVKANALLAEWFGFELLENVSPTDREFLTLMFNRRHLFTHNAGRVDEEYLKNTQDTKVRLNQVVSFKSSEIRHLLPLLRQMSSNLISGYESISW